MPPIESGTSDSTPGTTPPTTHQQQEEAESELPPSTFSDMGLTEHGDIIATTPVSGGNRTVVDIQQSFQEVGGGNTELEEEMREDDMIESIDETAEESRSLVSLTGLTKVGMYAAIYVNNLHCIGLHIKIRVHFGGTNFV